MMSEEKHRISLQPKLSTLQLSRMDRVISRLVSMESAKQPSSESEADLAGDVFHSLHRDPEMAAQPPSGRETNASLLKWIKEQASWDSVREASRGNIATSLVSSGFMWQILCSESVVQKALEKQAEADEARKNAEAKEFMANTFRNLLQGDELAKYLQDAADARSEADALQAAANDYTGRLVGNNMSSAMINNALYEANKKAQEINSALSGWGHGPGSSLRTNPQDAVAFIGKNSKRLAKIAKLAGRMRGIAFEARRQRTIFGVEPTDIDFSRDFKRIFPTEIALLSSSSPRGIREFQVAKFADVGLAGWEYTGSSDESGPFVCLIDESGSMRGDPEMVAKGIALGLAQIAKSENREYSLISFASTHDPVRKVTSKEGWAAHMDWADEFINGGTSFDTALVAAIGSIIRMDNPRATDVVFVSDGLAKVSDEVLGQWNRFAEENGVRLIYIAVGHSAAKSQVSEFASQIVEIASLDVETGDEIAKHLAQWIRP